MHVPGVGGLSPEWFRQHVWAISYLRWHQSLCARASGSLPGPSPELPWASGSYPGASGKLIDHFLFLIGFSIIVIPDAYDVPHGASASLCHWKRKLHQPKKEAGSAEGEAASAEEGSWISRRRKLLMTQTPASDNEPAMLPSRLWALSFAARKQTIRGPSTLC